MSAIGGKTREIKEFSKQVGLFEASVIAINPTNEEYKDILDIDLKEDSKATEYLGKDKEEDYQTLRIDVWLEDVKSKNKFKVNFYLGDKPRENKDKTKRQYINAVGVTSWADDPNNLPEWFKKRDFRVAYIGEEELYNFMRTWLGKLDYRDVETTLQLDWKALMKGNLKDLRSQIDGEFCTNVGCLATIRSVEKEGEVKAYQGVFNKAFLPAYTLKQFRLIDYSDASIQGNLKRKQSGDLKPHERFVLTVTGEYGCKDFYILKDLRDYDDNENIMSSNEPKMAESDSPDY